MSNKIILLLCLGLVGCSVASYDPSFQPIAGNVHACNQIMVGNTIKVGYSRCMNLELPLEDVQEYRLALEVSYD